MVKSMRKRRSYDFEEPAPPRDMGPVVWSLLSVLMLLGVACVAFVFILIFMDPYSSLNPFPPERPVLPTSTPTVTTLAMTLPPSWTPTLTIAPTETLTPTPTPTLFDTPTPISLTSTPVASETPIPTPRGGYPYEVRQGSPKAIPNIYHPELGCNWMGVGGQVVDRNDGPVTGIIVRLGGTLPGGIRFGNDIFTLTGVASTYGRAGYEFKLADQPLASRNTLWVQLVSQEGIPLSDKVFFTTYVDCDLNLILIDFKAR
jgi:hypothetical protein